MHFIVSTKWPQYLSFQGFTLKTVAMQFYNLVEYPHLKKYINKKK